VLVEEATAKQPNSKIAKAAKKTVAPAGEEDRAEARNEEASQEGQVTSLLHLPDVWCLS